MCITGLLTTHVSIGFDTVMEFEGWLRDLPDFSRFRINGRSLFVVDNVHQRSW